MRTTGTHTSSSQLKTQSMAAHHPGGNATLPVISFFKIILKTNLQRLKLPTMFTQKHGGAMSNPVLLKPHDGTEWKVYWTKQNGEIWLEKGWKEFAQNYSLDEGYLVVFEYKGTFKFDVLILDQSSLEIDYPSCVENGNLDQSDDESVEVLDEWPYQKNPKQKSPLLSPQPHEEVRATGEKGAERTSLSLNWPRGARAQEVAETFITNNPFFTVTMKPVDIAAYRLYVPGLEGYVENIDKHVKLQIGERSWDVKLLRRHATRGRCLSAGWSLFAMESELQVGDVCVFELINREDPLAFQVHVYKHNS